MIRGFNPDSSIWQEGECSVFGKNGSLETLIEAQLPASRQKRTENSRANFKDLQWTYLFNKKDELSKVTQDGQMKLVSNAANLTSQNEMAWYGRRQEEFTLRQPRALKFQV